MKICVISRHELIVKALEGWVCTGLTENGQFVLEKD